MVSRSLVALAALAGCGSDGSDADGKASGKVINVPADAPTITEAVAGARPGDLILIASGTYSESVDVATANIVIRGADRNAVILDGGDRLTNGFRVTANGVAIENLTVHNYVQNGVLFTGLGDIIDPNVVYGTGDNVLDGYRASYVTSYNNGLYGIYAFAARNGRIEHSVASGHPDSGIYVGQCQPCNVVLDDVTAERNAIGYYGTNASGAVYVINSLFTHNRLGVTPNSQKMEKLAPQVETFVVANRVIDNDDPNTPVIPQGFFGGGIAIGGGTKNVISKNLVTGHDAFGIGLIGLADFDPLNNRVEANALSGNALDLYYSPVAAPTDPMGNCFAGNSFTTSAPAEIETVLPCGSTPAALASPATVALPQAPPGVDYRTITPPASQQGMPDTKVPATPAVSVFVAPDLAALATPTA